MSFIRTKQQQSHEILKEKRTFINNTIERRQQGRAARPLHLHIIPNSRVQLKPTLVYKEFYFFFGSRGSVRAQANEIPLGNKRTDCSLDLFVDSAEINFLDTVVNGILLTVSWLFQCSLPRPNTAQFARTLCPSGLILDFLSAPEPK